MNPVQHLLILLIRVYRLTLSPAMTFLGGPFSQCRFTPSCSQYAIDAIRSRGPAAGMWLALRRVCRCHPWGGCGHDPVPGGQFGRRNAEGGMAGETPLAQPGGNPAIHGPAGAGS